MTKRVVEIKLQNGLEARPVAMLVQVASKYDSVVYLESAGNTRGFRRFFGGEFDDSDDYLWKR